MLGVKNYPKEYINACRKKIKADIDSFKKYSQASKAFEAIFFKNMILVLETMFMHRLRGQEGKDGNPLNEVRMLANSILTNNDKLLADSTIKYNEAKAVLKIGLGQEIALSLKDFEKLSDAYFSEIEKKFA
jgi:hypothetical protein